MAVRKVQNAYYVVQDVGAAVAFYRDVLGLSLKFQDGDRWAQFDAGGVTLALSSPDEGAVEPGQGAVVTLEVDDLEATIGQIRRHGIEPLGSVRDMGPHGRTVAIRDPAGNVVQLFQRS